MGKGVVDIFAFGWFAAVAILTMAAFFNLGPNSMIFDLSKYFVDFFFFKLMGV